MRRCLRTGCWKTRLTEYACGWLTPLFAYFWQNEAQFFDRLYRLASKVFSEEQHEVQPFRKTGVSGTFRIGSDLLKS